MTNSVLMTAVIPVYSGEKYLPQLVQKLGAVRDAWEQEDGCPLRLAECIFVLDEPIDGSASVLRSVCGTDPRMTVLQLSRNFGQHQATAAGVLYSSGDWVCTLDEDLQHDPEHMDAMLERAVTANCDVLYAKANTPVHGSKIRDVCSKVIKAMVARLSGNPHVRNFSSFRLIRGNVARAAASIATSETYFDVTLPWFTERIEALELPLKDRRFRQEGKSGYSFRRLLSHARRMVVTSQVKLLRVGGLIGCLSMLLSAVLFVVTFIRKLVQPEAIPVRGWTSLFLVLLFFGGLTSFLSAILIEFVSVIMQKQQGKPTFFTVDRTSDADVARWLREHRRED